MSRSACLAGETLHLDVQDVHPGYINFVNAAAFKVFGIDLRSLRYPLMAAAFTQAMLAWFFLAGRDALLATLASVASIALGVLQFLNPTAHWYALFVTACSWPGWAGCRRGIASGCSGQVCWSVSWSCSDN